MNGLIFNLYVDVLKRKAYYIEFVNSEYVWAHYEGRNYIVGHTLLERFLRKYWISLRENKYVFY